MNWQGLHIRLALTVALGTLVLALLSSLYAYQRGYQQSLSNSERSVRQLMNTVQVSAAIAVYVDNREIAHDVVQGLSHNDIVSNAILSNAKGFLLQAKAASSRNQKAITQNLFSPVDENEIVGNLTVIPNHQLIRDRARNEALSTVAQLVVQTVLVAALVLIAVYLLLTRPLSSLSLHLHKIEPGSAQRLSLLRGHQHDEIGKLTTDINTLLDTVSDILATERQLRARVEQLEQRFRGIFEDSSAGIYLLSAEGALLTANPAFLRSVGAQELSFLQQLGPAFIDAVFVEADELRRLIDSAVSSGRPSSADLCFRRQDTQQVRWAHCLISVSEMSDAQQAIEGVLYDITERKESEEAVRQQAEKDTLTGLYNRRYVENLLDQMTNLPSQGSFAIMLCDLDRFKYINDHYGHDAGDLVLKIIANRLRNAVREQDVVTRLGGDEFLILLRHMNNDSAIQRISSLLLKSVTQPIELSATQMECVGISIGITYFPLHAQTPHDLTRQADSAMYHVKRDGRNGYAIWHESEINVFHE